MSQSDGSDPSSGLESISQHARVLTRGTGAAIALAHKGSMICRASVGNAPTLGARLDISSGLSGECIRTGKTLRCDNSENDPRVDADSCRRLGIHSILAAPIQLGGEVVGILEVFSSQRFNFHDGDLMVVEDLAKTIFVVPPPPRTTPAPPTLKTVLAPPTLKTVPAPPTLKTVPAPPALKTVLAPPALKTLPAPKLLLELEPAWRVFLDNLTDLLFPPQTAPLKLTSRPAPFWPDVLVPSEPAWERFYQSIVLHVVMVAILGLVEFGLSQRPLLRQSRLKVNKSDTVYYLPPEYLRALWGESEPSQRPRAEVKPRVLAVRRESARSQKSVTPPTLHLKDSRYRLTAWNPVVPPVPFSATTRNPRSTPATSVAAIAPPPDTSAVSRAQRLRLATPQAVAPVPSVAPSASQRASISLGHQDVVRPAPEIPGGAQRSLSGATQASLGRGPTLVVPPPPSVGGSNHQTANISLGHVEVVRPAPEIPGDAQQSLSSTARVTLGRGATSVVPPPPTVGSLGNPEQRVSSRPDGATQVVPPPPAMLQVAGSYLIDTPDGGAILVVPPPPSIGGLERRGGQSASSLSSGSGMQVVPPAPRLQGTGTSARGTGNGMAMAIVPPPPSVGGLGGSGGQSASSLAGAGMQAVPPAPRLQGTGTSARGTGNGMAMTVVAPAPSVGGLGGSGGHGSSSQRAASMQVGQPKVTVQSGGDGRQGEAARTSGLPGGPLPGEINGNGGESLPQSKKATAANELGATKVLSISFIGPALALPQSSYFSNFEVFIAEERLSRHQSRIIKLVYDFLSYQPRLSDLGANYPAIENLHATRDPSCDEPLKQVVSLATSLHWPEASLVQLNSTSSKQRQSTLPCYRTTADDYRKAAHQHR